MRTGRGSAAGADAGASSRRVTRADVARLAGVSTAVVSYTLNAGTRKKVSDATRARVLEAVATLGYRPNAAARALKLGSTAQLGLVVPGVLNRFFADLTDHLEREAAARGLALLVTSSRDGVDAVIARLVDRQVDGVILTSGVDQQQTERLADLDVPAVLINREGTAGVAGVGVDRYQGARLAVGHLVEHGHRDIAYVGRPDEAAQRYRGWVDALAAVGAAPGPVIASDFSREHGYRAGQTLAALETRPTAVFISSDEQAVGALLALHEAGIAVPEEIAVTSFDGSQESAYCWPPLTTAAQPLAEMARLAVERVVTAEPDTDVELPAELVVRRSCGCPARSSPAVP